MDQKSLQSSILLADGASNEEWSFDFGNETTSSDKNLSESDPATWHSIHGQLKKMMEELKKKEREDNEKTQKIEALEKKVKELEMEIEEAKKKQEETKKNDEKTQEEMRLLRIENELLEQVRRSSQIHRANLHCGISMMKENEMEYDKLKKEFSEKSEKMIKERKRLIKEVFHENGGDSMNLMIKRMRNDSTDSEFEEDTSETSYLTVDPPTCILPASGGLSIHKLVNTGSEKIVYKMKISDNNECSLPVFDFIEPFGSENFRIFRVPDAPKEGKVIVRYAVAPADATDAQDAFESVTPAGTIIIPMSTTE